MAENVGALFTQREWGVIAERLNERRVMLDEGYRLFGERAWAVYLRRVFVAVDLAEFAARITPAAFTARPFEPAPRSCTPHSPSPWQHTTKSSTAISRPNPWEGTSMSNNKPPAGPIHEPEPAVPFFEPSAWPQHRSTEGPLSPAAYNVGRVGYGKSLTPIGRVDAEVISPHRLELFRQRLQARVTEDLRKAEMLWGDGGDAA